MASHDFQTALQNYLDLEDLRRKLESWQASFDAYDDLIRQRRDYYEPLLPGVDAQFRELDAQIPAAQRAARHPRAPPPRPADRAAPRAAREADERIALDRISATEAAIKRLPEAEREQPHGPHRAPARRADLDAAHAVSRAPDRGVRAPGRAGCGNRHASGALPVVRARAPGERAQLHGLRRWHTRPAQPRARLARARGPAAEAAGCADRRCGHRANSPLAPSA